MSERPVTARTRTHLANERTFLAWLRTGVTTMALGVAASQLLDERSFGPVPATQVLVGCLVGLGMLITALGWTRYRQAARAIELNAYGPGGHELELAAAGVAVVAAVSLFVILA